MVATKLGVNLLYVEGSRSVKNTYLKSHEKQHETKTGKKNPEVPGPPLALCC